MTLLRSQIIVGCCDAVIASLHRHDFHSCPCGRMAIDGGLDYLRVVGDYDFVDASFGVKDSLDLWEQRAVIATYIAIYRAFEDGRKNKGVPMSAIGKYQPAWFTAKEAKDAGLTLGAILGILVSNGIINRYPDGAAARRGKHFIRLAPLKPLEIRDV